MALYQIQTLITRHRVSLISYGDFPSDLAAILAARALLRQGEAMEIWRGQDLVYRMGPIAEWARPPLKSAAVRHSPSGPQRWIDLVMNRPIRFWPRRSIPRLP
jgi:hypothetical protein